MIVSNRKLFFELKISPQKLQSIISNIDNHYGSFTKETTKDNGTIKKREIRNPSNSLKIIQRNILKNILESIELPKYLHGSIKKRSNLTNAKSHQGYKYHLCTDIKNFFPSISHKQVYRLFINLGFSYKIASKLTQLTTYKGSLPQGTPTSSYLANLVFLSIDKELIDFCTKNHIIYTRYVDDLTFSSQQPFKSKVQDILKIVSKEFKYHHKKTFYKEGPVEVTGILVKQNRLKSTNKTKNKLRIGHSKASIKGIKDYIKRVESY